MVSLLCGQRLTDLKMMEKVPLLSRDAANYGDLLAFRLRNAVAGNTME
jgi:hypothetical protein